MPSAYRDGAIYDRISAPLERRVAAGRYVAKPRACHRHALRRTRRVRDGLREGGGLERGYEAREFLIAAGGEDVDRLAMVERRERAVQPHWHVVGVQQDSEPVDDRRELDQPFCARSRGRGCGEATRSPSRSPRRSPSRCRARSVARAF